MKCLLICDEFYSKASEFLCSFVRISASINEEADDLMFRLQNFNKHADNVRRNTLFSKHKAPQSVVTYERTVEIFIVSAHVSKSTTRFCAYIWIRMSEELLQRLQHRSLTDVFVESLHGRRQY